MSFADKQEAGRHNGQRLLAPEAMEHLQSLIDAQEGHAAAKTLHGDEIAELEASINQLNAAKERLLGARNAESTAQHKKINTHIHDLTKLAIRGSDVMNPVYASAIRGVNADKQHNLWHPSTLSVIDTTARSMIEVDGVLRSSGPQPIVVSEYHGGGWNHIMFGKTKRKGRIQPATKGIEKSAGIHRRLTQTHEALRLPVAGRSMAGYQLQTQGSGNLLPWTPYGAHALQNKFDLTLPAGYLRETREIGSYDQDGEAITLQGELGEGSMSSGRPYFAIGALSVTKFFDDLVQRHEHLAPHVDILRGLALGARQPATR